jgi:hypothetical protein
MPCGARERDAVVRLCHNLAPARLPVNLLPIGNNGLHEHASDLVLPITGVLARTDHYGVYYHLYVAGQRITCRAAPREA